MKQETERDKPNTLTPLGRIAGIAQQFVLKFIGKKS